MNLFPLCTANVCPTNSGSTVETRDQVFTTRFSFFAFSASTFLTNASCTNGPFFTLRPISRNPGLLSCLAALAAADDEPLRRLLPIARLHAFLLAPRAHDVATAASPTAVRVVDRVHDFATDLRTTALPARLAGLAPRHQLVLFVADRADRRVT